MSYRKDDEYRDALDELVYRRHVIDGMKLLQVAARLGVSIHTARSALVREKARIAGKAVVDGRLKRKP